MTAFIVTILVVVGVAVGVWFFKFRKPANSDLDSDSESQPNTQAPDPIDTLFQLNVDLRTTSKVGGHIRTACELVIDQLVDLIPKLHQSGLEPHSEMVWTVNRIATEYLPHKCIYPYLSLPFFERNQPDVIEQLMDSLARLHSELRDVVDALDSQDRSQFDQKAKFLKHRFTNSGDQS